MVSAPISRIKACFCWLLLILAAAGLVAAKRTAARVALPERDFAEYLLGRDLVVEATFLGADRLVRKPLGGCGTDLPNTPSLDLRLRISSVIFGTAEDSTIVVSTLGQPQFPPAVFVPGARVIAWGGRECADGWRLWGNMVIVTPSGDIVGDYNAQGLVLRGQSQDRPIRYSALMASLTALSARHSARYFVGKTAIALVKVRQLHRAARGLFTYECDSLGWVIGSASRVPRLIDVNVGNLGCPWARAGDTLLVPVPEVQVSDRATLPGCSAAMLVKNGFARGFGVPVAFLPYALRAGALGLELRPYISRE